MNNGWLRVAIGAIVLTALAVGVNALSHHTLSTSPLWPALNSVLLVPLAGLTIIALVCVAGGLLWLVNPRLGGRGGRRATRDATTLLLLGALVVVAGLVFLSNRVPDVPRPQVSGSPSSKPGGPSHVADPPSGGVVALPEWLGRALLAALLLTMLALAAILLLRQLRRRTAVAAAPVSPALPPLAVAARLGRDAVLADDTSPRAAIIRCFAAMEDALAGRQEVSPLDSDTPVEVLERAWRRGLIRPEPARVLLRLFALARFSDHPVTEDARTAAADALSDMLDDLRERTA